MFLAALGAGALAVSLATSTLVTGVPTGATVEVTAFAGDGCSAGTTEAWPSPDRTAFSVYTRNFNAVVADVRSTTHSQSCELIVRITPTAGHRRRRALAHPSERPERRELRTAVPGGREVPGVR